MKAMIAFAIATVMLAVFFGIAPGVVFGAPIPIRANSERRSKTYATAGLI